MATLARLIKSPGGLCALVLMAAWLASWALQMWLWPGMTLAGVPLITWSQIVLGALAIVTSIVLIWKMESYERQ